MFFRGSRYANVPTHQIVDEKGRSVLYKKTRFIQQPKFRQPHPVSQQDRADLVAYAYLHDAERFWRICDLNYALWPDDLFAVPGCMIKIPTSED